MCKVILTTHRERNIFNSKLEDIPNYDNSRNAVKTTVKESVQEFLDTKLYNNNALVIKQSVGAGKTTKTIELSVIKLKMVD